MFLPLLGERAGVRASVSSNLIFEVVGSHFPVKTTSFRAHSRLCTFLNGQLSAKERTEGAKTPHVLSVLGGYNFTGRPVAADLSAAKITLWL